MQTYHLFISHSWNYAHAHDNLVRLLGARPDFSFKNFSVPPHNPIMGAQTDKQLEEAIENKIRPCSAVLIMAGVYATHSKWINKEIEIAQRMGCPIGTVRSRIFRARDAIDAQLKPLLDNDARENARP